MRKKLLALLLTLSSCVFSTAIMADPLPDNSFLAQKAGWFPSVATTCAQICFKQTAVAENESYVVVTNGVTTVKKSYVCKISARNAKGEMYGNNFYDTNLLKNQCMAVDHLGKVYTDRSFKCLCVKGDNIGPINPPEPPFINM